MNISTHQNTATVTLSAGETFYFKESILSGVGDFNWCFLPPHPAGSPISRILHRCYFNMKQVTAESGERTVQTSGYLPRGSFHVVQVPAGARFYINPRHLAGFCGRTAAIHTHIKVAPVFWALREHFFPVFTGPAAVLLYGPSTFEERPDAEFHPSRIVAFNIGRRFTASCPRPTRLASQMWNVVSNAITWRFDDPGHTVVESHHQTDHPPGRISPKEIALHLLGVLKL